MLISQIHVVKNLKFYIPNYVTERFKIVEKNKLTIYLCSDTSDFLSNTDFHI